MKKKIISKEEINNKFILLNDKAKENKKIMVKDEELERLKDSFINRGDDKISNKMKSAMSKVINKYILDRKKKNAKKQYNMLSKEKIKQINENNILELNYSIKNINNNIYHIKQLVGNCLSDRIYN